MIERVQVAAMKAIFKKQFTSYKDALKIANIRSEKRKDVFEICQRLPKN